MLWEVLQYICNSQVSQKLRIWLHPLVKGLQFTVFLARQIDGWGVLLTTSDSCKVASTCSESTDLSLDRGME